jgi:hypothetical protein
MNPVSHSVSFAAVDLIVYNRVNFWLEIILLMIEKGYTYC